MIDLGIFQKIDQADISRRFDLIVDVCLLLVNPLEVILKLSEIEDVVTDLESQFGGSIMSLSLVAD